MKRFDLVNKLMNIVEAGAVVENVLKYEKIIIAGDGAHTQMLLEAFPQLQARVTAISTPVKRQDRLAHLPVIEEAALPTLDYDAILISSHSFETVILERLADRGIPREKIHTLYRDKDDWLERRDNFRQRRIAGTFKKKVLGFFGHHKAATTWICSIFHRVGEALGLNQVNLYDSSLFGGKLRDYIIDHDIEMFSYTNADYRYVKELENDVLGFHVVRDPRDICVSGYYSHLYSHPADHWPALADHRQKLQFLSQEEGLLLEMEFSRWNFNHMDRWNYSNPRILELKMEELIRDPGSLFDGIFRHLHLLAGPGREPGKVSAATLREIIAANRFSQKAGGRQPGKEDVKSHYRKGTPGDWLNHFKPRHIDFFKANYNPLLIRLGYEEKEEWERGYLREQIENGLDR
jgi:hypothetical protein